MSTISAGTTSNTALKQTGDTTGNLVLQINGTTTALTLNTSGAVGVGTSPSYGTSGQVLTSAGSAAAPTWSSAGGGSPGGSNTQFQYNNSSAFAGAANLVYNANGPIVTSLGVGSTTPSASGAGIAFPATQSASTDVNTLDDYEEGTWTPSVGGTATYGGANAGKYTKIGNTVFLSGQLQITSIGTGSTSLISGVPFTAFSTNFVGSTGYSASLTATVASLGSAFGVSTSSINFTSRSITGTYTEQTNIFQDGARLIFSIVYQIA